MEMEALVDREWRKQVWRAVASRRRDTPWCWGPAAPTPSCAGCLRRLVEGYWKPAYEYLRIKWRADNEEARDLSQAFFARALEKPRLPSRGDRLARRAPATF